MIAAVDIFHKVESGVVALNGEVVRRALARHCCNYPSNANIFAALLTEYIDERMQAHYWKVRWNHGWERMNYHDAHGRYAGHAHRAEYIRADLRQIWPCNACIHIFNPTHRSRRFPQLVC